MRTVTTKLYGVFAFWEGWDGIGTERYTIKAPSDAIAIKRWKSLCTQVAAEPEEEMYLLGEYRDGEYKKSAPKWVANSLTANVRNPFRHDENEIQITG